MKKINWNDIRLVLMLGIVVFLYSFSSGRNETRLFKAADIKFTPADVDFITHDKVNKLLIQNYDRVTSIRKDKLDLNKVEKTLEENPMIEKAEVYTTIDGKLKAQVRQKTPIARIYEGVTSYYVDRNGKEMPLSETFTARVPLVTGALDKIEKENLHALLIYIYNDDFLKKNIIGIEIRPSGNIRMLNRNYDYEILFGKTVNMERKFNNYKAFLQDAVKDTLIENYKTINLKFTQQVVCTKK